MAKTTAVLVRLSPEKVSFLDAQCARLGVPRATVIQLWISEKQEQARNTRERPRKSFFDLTREDREEILTATGREAIARIHAMGLPTTHGDDEGIYRLFPDGHKEYIDKADRNG